jgi:hypothetical protein
MEERYCHHCQSTVENSEAVYASEDDRQISVSLCNACLQQYTVYCESCDDTHYSEDNELSQCEICDLVVCADCLRHRAPEICKNCIDKWAEERNRKPKLSATSPLDDGLDHKFYWFWGEPGKDSGGLYSELLFVRIVMRDGILQADFEDGSSYDVAELNGLWCPIEVPELPE